MAKVTLILEDGVRPDGTEVVSMEVESDNKNTTEVSMAEVLAAEAFAYVTSVMAAQGSPGKLVEPVKKNNNEEMN